MAASSPLPHLAERKQRFAGLFEAQYDYVYRSLRRLGVTESEVEDVAHDMFMTVYRKLDDLDASRSAKPWLFAFAVRFAADHRRLARHRVVPGEDLPLMSGTPSPEESAARAEETSLALRALGRLTVEVSSVFIAYELDDVPMKEIAETLGIPLNTAYSRLRIAREQLCAACEGIRHGEADHGD